MCRLLTLIEPDPALQDKAVQQFGDLAESGAVPPGLAKGHADGWGVVTYKNGEIQNFEKQPVSAYQNPAFINAASKHSSPSLLLAHLRKASVGSISPENTQPYVWNSYSFCHNGTIFNPEKLKVSAEFQLAKKGTADSEVLFLWLVQKMNLHPHPEEVFAAAGRELQKLDYTATNILFTDGKLLFALRQANEKNTMVARDNLCDTYYTLFLGKQNGKTKIICSQKLDLDGVTWSEIPNHAFAMINLENGEEKIVTV
jgi:predicted glutamine amidotransferase